jgi:hypothetical protein
MPIIKLDKEREIKFTTGAIKRFKALTGKNFYKMGKMDELEPEEFSALIYSCLGSSPDITLEEMDEFVEVGKLPVIMAALVAEAEVKTEDPLASGGLSSATTIME